MPIDLNKRSAIHLYDQTDLDNVKQFVLSQGADSCNITASTLFHVSSTAFKLTSGTNGTNVVHDVADTIIDNTQNINTLQANITTLSEILVQPRNNSATYADGSPAICPPNNDAPNYLLSQQGWYYIKSSAPENRKHNWYLEVPSGLKVKHLKSLQLHCNIMPTTDPQGDSEMPFFGIYTTIQGDEKNAEDWYRSRITWAASGNTSYEGKKCFRVKIDSTREDIPNGDYEPVECKITTNSIFSTGSSSTLADIGEETVGMIHVSSDSVAAAHQEYFVTNLKIQLESYTYNYQFNGSDLDFQNQINVAESKITQEISDRKSAVTAEQGRATGAETLLQENINSEATSRASADTAEQTARIASDATLQSNIDSEAALRASADTLLEGKIDAEKARIDAILNLSTHDLDTFHEIAIAYKAADFNLLTLINTLTTEFSALKGAVDSLAPPPPSDP